MKVSVVLFLVSGVVMLVAGGTQGGMGQTKREASSIRMPYGDRFAPSQPEPFAPQVFSETHGRYNLHLHSSLYFSHDGRRVLFAHQDRP